MADGRSIGDEEGVKEGNYDVLFNEVQYLHPIDTIPVYADDNMLPILVEYELITHNLTINIDNPAALGTVAQSPTALDGFHSGTKTGYPGKYLVSFNDIAGYTTPRPIEVTLDSDITIEVEYEIEPPSQYTMTFNITGFTSPVTLGITVTPGGSYAGHSDGSGTNSLLLDVGTYTVDFRPVNGYIDPNPIVVTLDSDKTVHGEYIKIVIPDGYRYDNSNKWITYES